MCKLCVFAGTTEGRFLAEFLAENNARVTVCVATEYGQTLLPRGKNLTVSARRLTEEEMEALFRRERFDLVVDATHPYADVVTENIAAACAATGTPCHRLLRAGGNRTGDVWVSCVEEAVSYLAGTEGTVFLTTGSKELHKFAALPDFSERVYARVLPMEDSLRLCREAGLKPAHILAMQGPFSKEMDLAALRQVGAKYLVTKDSGTAGGVGEKLAAAEEAGVKTVVIGQPRQRPGTDLDETVRLLCDRFGFRDHPRVSVVGIGPGSREALTGEAEAALTGARCLIGAKRMLEAVALPGQAVFPAISPEEIRDIIRNHPAYREYAVVMSGDVGFFSGCRKLLPLLTDCRVQVVPGISSLVYLSARLGTSYEDVECVTLHGRENPFLGKLRRGRRLFVLVGGENGMGKLCRRLCEAGLGQTLVQAGENLSYENERITVGTAEDLQSRAFDSLCAAILSYPGTAAPVTAGLPDGAFIRTETVPMTKSEIRAVCLSKLALPENAVCWDVGAGTGSVSIEMALHAERGQVYAIERKEAALAVLEENRQRFCADNLTVVPGTAPEACRELPAPTHAFIGGSSGNMAEILRLLLEKNPRVRIVAAAVTLESVGELAECMKKFPFAGTEVVSVTVARNKKAGPYNLMTGLNPVYIFTMEGTGA